MKKSILILFLYVATFAANSQVAISYEKVIVADGVSKDVIFSKVSEWIAASFIGTDGDYYANRTDGVITKDYQFPYEYGSIMYKAYDGTIRCKIKVEVKDGRFKVTFFNFIHKAIPRPNQVEDFSMLLINDSENSGKRGLNKSAHDKVWKAIKVYCKDIADKNFLELSKISFNTNSEDW